MFNGHCTFQSPCQMPLVLSSTGTGTGGNKPIRVAEPDVPAGPYTLRIGNSGPGPETVLYEIWLR